MTISPGYEVQKAENPPLRAPHAHGGVWVSRDPLGEEGGLNMYSYCFNNFTNAIDPLGLDTLSLFDPSSKEFANQSHHDNPGSYSVAAHGDQYGVSDIRDGMEKTISPTKLADEIKHDPKYDSAKPVRLNICYAGAKPAIGKAPSFAQQLADELCNTVYAPTTAVYWGPWYPYLFYTSRYAKFTPTRPCKCK